MDFSNAYEDVQRAASYAKLEFPGTYYLAYRDLPQIILDHVPGRQAIDFGCGTGRSTRFLERIGFKATGIDIAPDMIEQAQDIDPQGDYRLINDGNFSQFQTSVYDLVLAVFTFDNIPTLMRKVSLFKELGKLLNADGKIVSLMSSPEVYTHEWASFSTRDFPENKLARCGDTVKIIITDVDDGRPIEDIVWPDKNYREVFAQAGLEAEKIYKPLANESEPYPWINETKIAPWTIYVLKNI